MRPINKFLRKPLSFWACVRSLSQKIGYSKKGDIIIPTIEQMTEAFHDLGLNEECIVISGKPTRLATDLHEYFSERSRVLINEVEPKLMNAEEASELFNSNFRYIKPNCPIPMNKQKGDKRAQAFLTALVNMMIEEHSKGMDCDYDPRELTTFTRNDEPLRTLSRRVDGAFPSTVNPVAIWEIKEYYYTTTFGSRVADGVYETLLDGMEIEDLRDNEDINVKH